MGPSHLYLNESPVEDGKSFFYNEYFFSQSLSPTNTIASCSTSSFFFDVEPNLHFFKLYIDALDNLEDILRDSTSMVPNSMIPDMLKATQNIFDVINEIVKNIYKEDKANLIQSYIDTMKLRNASSDTVLPPIESHAFKEMFKRLNEYSYDTYMVIGLGKVQESYVPGMIKKGVTIRGEYKLCYEAIEFANVLCINPRKRTFRCEKHKNKNVIHSTGDISFEDVDTIPDKKLRGFKVKEIIEAMDRLDKILKDLGASNER